MKMRRNAKWLPHQTKKKLTSIYAGDVDDEVQLRRYRAAIVCGWEVPEFANGRQQFSLNCCAYLTTDDPRIGHMTSGIDGKFHCDQLLEMRRQLSRGNVREFSRRVNSQPIIVRIMEAVELADSDAVNHPRCRTLCVLTQDF